MAYSGADKRFENYAPPAAVTNIDGTSDVDDVNEELDLTAHGFRDGEQVLYENGADNTNITGLTDGDIYWAHVIDENTISLHNSRNDALDDNSRIGLTDTASSTTNSLTPQVFAIVIDTAGTYNLDNFFFDQSGTADIELIHTSGEVIINITGGGTDPTIVNRDGGTFTKNNNVTLTIEGQIVGETLVIYDLDDANFQDLGTELERFDIATASEDYVYDVSKASDSIIIVMIPTVASGYKYLQREITLPSVDSTVTLSPELETN